MSRSLHIFKTDKERPERKTKDKNKKPPKTDDEEKTKLNTDLEDTPT